MNKEAEYSSAGEDSIGRWLASNRYFAVPQKRFKGCEYKNRLPFDFYLPDYGILIEFDGEQHFRPVEHFGGKKGFELQKKKDRIKTKWANENGYHLIRIKYSEDIEVVLEERIEAAIAMSETNSVSNARAARDSNFVSDAPPNQNSIELNELGGVAVVVIVSLAVWYFAAFLFQCLTSAFSFLSDMARASLPVFGYLCAFVAGVVLIAFVAWFIKWNVQKILAERNRASTGKFKGACPSCRNKIRVVESNADLFFCPFCNERIGIKKST